MTLQLQPGKWYRQRDGGKAYVAAELPDELSPDGEGFVFIGVNRYGEYDSWRIDGAYLQATGTDLDLVAEWVDEPTDAEIADAVRWLFSPECFGSRFPTMQSLLDAYRAREGA